MATAARLRIKDEFSFAVRMEKIARIYRNIHNPMRERGISAKRFDHE
jgi:hypothetical protein